MAFFKYSGIFCLFIGICLGGFLYSNRYIFRTRELMRAVLIVNTLRQRLTFTLDTPEGLFFWLATSPTFQCDYVDATCLLMQRGVPFREAFTQSIDKSEIPFQQEDKRLLLELANIVGTSDLESQLSQLTLLSESLKQQHQRSESVEFTQKKLVRTLSVLGGMTVVILLI